MRVTVTISGQDAGGIPSLTVYDTELLEGSAKTPDGFGVIRKFSSPDGKNVWVTFLDDGERSAERIYEEIGDGTVRLIDMSVLSMVAENGSEAIRSWKER